jgi:mRNA export factor
MFGVPAAAPAANPLYNPNKDFEVANPPQDGVAALSFSSRANHLAAASWDGSAYVWEVQPSGQAVPKATTSCGGQPCLAAAWSNDGASVFLGGCDRAVRLWDLASGQARTIGTHDAPVRHAAHLPELNLVVTGSWDKTLRYWDPRSPTASGAAFTYNLPERCYALDVLHPLMVVGTAERHLLVFNLAQPQQPYKQLVSPLKWQTRCVACFPNKSGYLVGSIEGRVAVHHVEDSVGQTSNFTFKCHRDDSDIYPVNSCAFHPQHGTFVTAGGDGTYNFWDKDSKQRLRAMQRCCYPAAGGGGGVGGQQATEPAPIPCGAFNSDGSIYAYAVSYDWSRGHSAYNPQTMRTHVLLHACQDQEVKPRPKVGARK